MVLPFTEGLAVVARGFVRGMHGPDDRDHQGMIALFERIVVLAVQSEPELTAGSLGHVAPKIGIEMRCVLHEIHQCSTTWLHPPHAVAGITQVTLQVVTLASGHEHGEVHLLAHRAQALEPLVGRHLARIAVELAQILDPEDVLEVQRHRCTANHDRAERLLGADRIIFGVLGHCSGLACVLDRGGLRAAHEGGQQEKVHRSSKVFLSASFKATSYII